MQQKPHILYVHIGLTTFVKKDMALLAERFELLPYAFAPARKSLVPLQMIHQLFFLLFRGWKVKAVVCQFAGYHVVLPGLWAKLRSIPHLIIASGTESASYPSIHYGNYHKWGYRVFTRWSMILADHIAPVHESLMHWENHYYPVDGPAQGIFAHIPGLQKPYTTIPYGYDATKWPEPTQRKTPATGITIAFIPDRIRYELKGIDLLVAAARSLPEMQFTIVGMSYRPEEEIPSNMRILGPTPHEELNALLEQHAFYFQLSISEGHPNALCEGMLKACVPIGSAVTSIPEIIGETGYVLAERSVEQLIPLLQQALAGPWREMGQAARRRIIERYPQSLRGQGLQTLVQQLMERDE